MASGHTVVETGEFRADARSLKLDRADIERIVVEIAQDPSAGDLVRDSGGLRKRRIARERGGKSGGYRVLSLYVGEDCPVYLMAMLSKGERANFSAAELKELRRIAAEIKDGWRRRRR